MVPDRLSQTLDVVAKIQSFFTNVRLESLSSSSISIYTTSGPRGVPITRVPMHVTAILIKIRSFRNDPQTMIQHSFHLCPGMSNQSRVTTNIIKNRLEPA